MDKKLKLFVLASLLLNVLLASALIGQSLQRGDAPRGDRIMAVIDASSLPEARKTAWQEKFGKLFSDEDGARAQGRAAREDSLALLQAASFDKTAYLHKVEEGFALMDTRRGDVINAFADLAGEMDARDRAALAEVLRRPPVPPMAGKAVSK